MANHFGKHHSAAKKAFDGGDHSKAMHHIGHMMMAVRNAAKGAGYSPAGASIGAPSAGVDTGPVSAPGDSMTADFGGVQRAPSTATPAPTGATAFVKPNGFNRNRFAAMKGRK
jgi:hypothetical protein